MNCDCLSVGILVADHLCSPIARLPAAGELVLADALPLSIGGCASNTAIDLARLAWKVELAGCVGRDPFGRFIIDTLRQSQVGTSAVRELEGVGTSGTLIINLAGEDRRYIHMPGANNAFTVRDIPLEALRTTRVLYVGGYLLMQALDQDELAEVFREARRQGVTTVLDVVLPGQGDHWSRLERVLGQTDVFLPNSDEAAAITGLADPPAQAEKLLATGLGTAIITCGEGGTLLARKDLKLRAGIYKMPYVGGTGAGDAFDAGYISGLLAGLGPRDCLAWGSALGASCVRSVSATESVFTREEAEAFLAANPLEVETL